MSGINPVCDWHGVGLILSGYNSMWDYSCCVGLTLCCVGLTLCGVGLTLCGINPMLCGINPVLCGNNTLVGLTRCSCNIVLNSFCAGITLDVKYLLT